MDNEFSFLISDESIFNENKSKEYIEMYYNFIDINSCASNSSKTYQGIKIDDIKQCITLSKSILLPWLHTKFTIDFSYLKTIDGRFTDTLIIPGFIEELSSTESFDVENNLGRITVNKIIIPESVAEINDKTFSYYSKLTKIQFNKNSRLRVINNNAIVECPRLKKIDYSNCKYLDDTIGE